MAMTRGTPLVNSLKRITELTAFRDLENIDNTGEPPLDLTKLLETASDAVFDMVDASGLDPTKLTNQFVLEIPVAYYFLGALAARGTISAPEGETAPKDPWEWAKPHYDRVRLRIADVDDRSRPNQAGLSLGNFDRKGRFDRTRSTSGETWDDLPRRR